MNLYECDGKALLKQAGIAIPAGQLAKSSAELPLFGYPWLAKAQVLAGGRGKAGFVRQVKSSGEARDLFEDWLGKRHRDEPLRAVLFEQAIVAAREIYLAISIDGRARAPVVIASNAGGIDIESVDDRQILRERINPCIGLQGYQVRKVVAFLGLTDAIGERMASIVTALYDVFTRYRCELVELNPLALTGGGDLIALDAKVIADGTAGIASLIPSHDDDSALTLEERYARLGIVAVESGGEVAVITTGAGCAMATADSVASLGGTVKGIVDLGGVLASNAEKLGEYIGMVREWRPRVALINLFMQATDLEKLAQAIVVAKRVLDPRTRLVIRFKGYGFDKGVMVLDANGIPYTSSFDEACREAVR
jgi:succinyl-CoA synthetase beta subunit